MRRCEMDRTIKVTGRGKIAVKPDTIQLNITAEGTFKDYGEIFKRSTEDTEKVRRAIADAGLDPKELKTASFGINTEYEGYNDRNGNWKQRFKGYRYDHRMNLRFPIDNEVLGKVLYELSRCSVAVQFNMMYTVKDVEAVKNDLLAKAVSDSKAKAQVLAEASGVSLGEIVNIDYSWGELDIYSNPLTFGSKRMNSKMDCDEAAFDLDMEADDINVQDTVTILWEIK
jgi:uncharacterized protein YggE